MVKFLISRGARLSPRCYELRVAIRAGDKDVVGELFRLKELTDGHDELGRWWAPVHYAVRSRKLEMIEYVLGYGYDINTWWRDPALSMESKVTPLYYAIAGGMRDVVTLLLDRGADITRVFGNMPAIFAAADRRCTDILKTLLDRGGVGGDVNTIHDGNSLLHRSFILSFPKWSKPLFDLLLSSPALLTSTQEGNYQFAGLQRLCHSLGRSI
jgi:hypothetical protein